MESTINMQDIRHLNLFSQITKIDTRFCFEYNNTIFFCVPRHLISKAIGEDGRNSKQLSRILERNIRIIFSPSGVEESGEFIQSIIHPVEFRSIDVRDNEIIINAGAKNKAALIGREKRRFFEMKKIVKDFFGREFRII
ncbi:MAG: hypothetical protein PHH00_01730 [Candidatus Nanoarchaeia archaeon]|nr:hypothetical protein [Candidatus Nanoarchaeia archaeon]